MGASANYTICIWLVHRLRMTLKCARNIQDENFPFPGLENCLQIEFTSKYKSEMGSIHLYYVHGQSSFQVANQHFSCCASSYSYSLESGLLLC